MTIPTPSELDRLADRRNQDFDGEAHLTVAELDSLLASAREALAMKERIAELESALASAEWKGRAGGLREAAKLASERKPSPLKNNRDAVRAVTLSELADTLDSLAAEAEKETP